VQTVECRSCGWSERWNLGDEEGGMVLGA
jgi:hypothetical protein